MLKEIVGVLANVLLIFVVSTAALFTLYPYAQERYAPDATPELIVLDLASLALEVQASLSAAPEDRKSVIEGDMARRLDVALNLLAQRGVLIVDSASAIRLPAGRVLTRQMVMSLSEEAAQGDRVESR